MFQNNHAHTQQHGDKALLSLGLVMLPKASLLPHGDGSLAAFVRVLQEEYNIDARLLTCRVKGELNFRAMKYRLL